MKQIEDVNKVIREYLPNVIHMSLGTSKDNIPWVCEVHYVFDEDLNLYFRSTASRRHSLEIAENPNVAGNIIKQHQPGEKPRGVYFDGVAEMLTDVNEDSLAYKLYCERFGTTQSILEEAKKEDGHKFYKITVNNYYVFDTIDSSPSKKYVVDWKGNNE